MSLVTANVLLVIFCLLGLLGTILPSVPGTLFIWLSAVIYAYFTDFSMVTVNVIVQVSILAAFGQVSGYLISLVGAKIAGASRRGVIGALVGGVVGLIIGGPLGLLLGSFGGAVIMELTHKELGAAVRAGLGALVGSMGGMVLEFLSGLVMLFLIFRAVF